MGPNIDNCYTGEVFESKKYPEIKKENVWTFAWDRGWKEINARPTLASSPVSCSVG